MSGSRLTLFYIAISILCFRENNCDFDTDFLGDFVSDKDYNDRTFCWTSVCMYDGGRLLYDADHNSKATKPCDNFPTFAMGEFLKHRVLNDRYSHSGFQNDIELQYYE